MKKIILLVLMLAAVIAFFTFGGEQYLRPDFYIDGGPFNDAAPSAFTLRSQVHW